MQQIVDFILELDRLKAVTRRIRLRHADRYENSAEHSWHIALLAASLARYAEEPVDVDKVICMLLIHDIGEIDAGDMIFFAVDGWAERKAAERASVMRIFGMLEEPERSRFIALWQEFEEGVTPEARFANAADRAMPVLLNLANGGQSWRDNGISHDVVVDRVAPQIRKGCPALWSYIEVRLEEEHRNGWFGAAAKD